MPDPITGITALVLCGGESRRLGTDKTAAPLGGSTVLDHLLAGLPAAWPVVAVGPERPVGRSVRWTREDPVGGGPVAAVAAGLTLADGDLVVLLAGDQPFAGGVAVRLVAALRHDPPTEAVVATDATGRRNPLLAAYRTAALRRALPDPPADAPARALPARLATLEMPVDPADGLDVDTPAALAEARRRVGP